MAPPSLKTLKPSCLPLTPASYLLMSLTKIFYKYEIPGSSEELPQWWSPIIKKAFNSLHLQLLTEILRKETDYFLGNCEGMVIALSAGASKKKTGIFLQTALELERKFLQDPRKFPVWVNSSYKNPKTFQT